MTHRNDPLQFASEDAEAAALWEEYATRENASKSGDRDWPVTCSFSTRITNTNFVPIHFPSLESLARCACGGALDQTVKKKSDCPVYTPSVLNGPERRKVNVGAVNLFIADYDKGHATPQVAHARLLELNLYGATGPSFSYGATSHKVAWSVTAPSRKTGRLETSSSPFQKFCNGTATDAAATSFAVEMEGYDANALGRVTLGDLVTETIRQTTTTSYVFQHSRIPKLRSFVAIEPIVRGANESTEAFSERYESVYHGIAKLIGIPYDTTCASLERAYFGFYRNAIAADLPPILFSEGSVLRLDDARLLPLIVPDERRSSGGSRAKHRGKPPAHSSAKDLLASARRLMGETGAASKKWIGFRAADAAAHTWSDVTDKRATNNLVALECPFLAEHVTSNRPGSRQLAIFNPKTAASAPYCKCQAETCRDRPAHEFLEALFDNEIINNPQFRSK